MSRRRIDGVDLSHYQGSLQIIWSEACKAGVKFVYHKASEGTDWVDKSYNGRRQEAASHGVKFGAYHFAHPEPGTAEAEAMHFLAVAKPAPGDLAPALDLEVNEHTMSEDQLAEWVHTWFMVVFKAIGVQRGVLYTPFDVTSVPTGVTLWVARYNNDNRLPHVPTPFKQWSMWQFSNGSLGLPSAVPGIGRVDINTLHRRFGFARLNRLVLPTAKAAPVAKPASTPIDKIVSLAKSQVGYHEGRSGGHWNNIQKFSPAVPSLAWSQGQAWCCTFVSWLALKSNLAAFYPCTASCDTARAWWKAKNRWSEYPAVGAQVIYGTPSNAEHTGLVVGYDDTYLYAIEGNTNNNGSAEGDGVYLKKRLRRDPYVQGYGYPQIPGVRLKSADPNYKEWT